MFPKLVVVVLTIGACACTLLSIRQARLQAAHELARAQLRVHEADDRLWAVRAEIGRRVVPDHVRQMADALGSFRPMLPLPGDVDRRSMYAQGSQPQTDPAPDPEAPVKIEQKPRSSPQAEVRTVSQTQTKSKPKPRADNKSDSKPDTKPSSKPAKPASKPETSPDKKSVAKSDSKAKTPPKPTRQAAADRREPAP